MGIRRKVITGRKPKLLVLSTSGVIGGTERVAINLTRAFRARGWGVRLVFSQTDQSDALVNWCNAQGVVAEASPALLICGTVHTNKDMFNLRRLVREGRPDVVNLHYGYNYMSLKDVLAVRLARKRCVVTINHPAPWDETPRRRIMTRIASHFCHEVVVISHATRDTLLKAGIPAHKITLIYPGLPVPASMSARAEARVRLGLPADAFIVGSLAQLVPHKGIADIIEAMSALPVDANGPLLVIAGNGPERSSLQHLGAARLGERAIFFGHVADTADIYAAIDVFALPTYSEGFGLVYVEAALHGVPSVGTWVGGVPDAVQDGVTGLLISPGDINALTTALVQLRNDRALRERLGIAAFKRARAEFAQEHMADHYERILV